MKRNIAELPAVIRLARKLLANRFLITNVLPYTAETCTEMLYSLVMRDAPSLPSPWVPHLSLSKMDLNEKTQKPLFNLIRDWQITNFGKDNIVNSNNYCPFIENGSTTICWDGSLSSCPH